MITITQETKTQFVGIEFEDMMIMAPLMSLLVNSINNTKAIEVYNSLPPKEINDYHESCSLDPVIGRIEDAKIYHLLRRIGFLPDPNGPSLLSKEEAFKQVYTIVKPPQKTSF